ncbi:SMP-30/gluconolactonase/LRE family protein [Rubripirellula reticaptiva]|uniref:Virginiamycin B lyase n=1 Tax=Rubripirellula reticaptiva TaxID=2528013 RepID=A0A5C6EIP6_9BACT|nr:SMP-30/gluconolactonase/LRE family protein [Rubripirellula reticaptiva]TWU48374.1 Virginiamycin B lyase [Rubripirellula reticaptiva]
MSKSFVIRTICHPAFHGAACFTLALALFPTAVCSAQDVVASAEADAKSEPAADVAEPAYPLAVAIDGTTLYAVDLDLPGVWKIGEKTELFARGTNLLRKPMNRPRCVAIDPRGGIFVGDSATREVYRIESADAEPVPLTAGYIGIPMAICLDADGKTMYVGDAEKRATFKMPIEGGKPELVARVNARGLAFDEDGNLWAVTPDADAVVKIDVKTGDVTNVITDRPYQYPNGLTWSGGEGFVTDGYGKAIWKFTADGKTEKWHEGEPLVGPVGITATEDSIYVADPKQKQIYQFDRKTKKAVERMK